MKYEYYLKFWGEIENDNWVKKDLGIDGTDFWFTSKKERTSLKNRIVQVATNRDCRIVFNEEEGYHTRLKTIAFLEFEYENEIYRLKYDFGFAFPPNVAYFQWCENNYSCDCNRSIFLRKKYPNFPELDCGETIKLLSIKVRRV